MPAPTPPSGAAPDLCPTRAVSRQALLNCAECGRWRGNRPPCVTATGREWEKGAVGSDNGSDPHRAAVGAILRAGGVAAGSVTRWERMGEATFNAAYRLGLDDGRQLVVKVAPNPAAASMSYEHDLLRTEALFYRAAATTVPVPRVVHADFSRQVIGSDVLVMTALPGDNWHSQRHRIDADDRARLRARLGGWVAALHRVTGDGFGYPQDPLLPGWRAAFTAMADAALADAERFGASLPCPTARLRDAIWRNADALDEVTTAVLVHFDLWEGNVLVHQGALSGVVDGERAFWGDPLADMASLALLGDIERDEDFLTGYRAAGGQLTFDDPARRRLSLYRCYLYLIMLVEAAPRGYLGAGHDEMARLVSEQLVRAVTALET